MNRIDVALKQLSESDAILPQIVVSDLIWFLEQGILCEIERILYSGNCHGVAFVSEEDDSRISSFETFTFSPKARNKNLGWHLDTFHIPESVDQRLTALYSPLGSFSHIPTFTTRTEIVDAAAREAFSWFDVPAEVVEQYASKICQLIGSETRAYWTLLQNTALADIRLNEQNNGVFFQKRDVFTCEILDDPLVEKWQFLTSADQASLFFFRNGLWPNRDIAHTRFCLPWSSNESAGDIHNISIQGGWIIHTKNKPSPQTPSDIRYVVGQFNPRT